MDEQGLSLPGVTVNVESPNLQGIASSVTSENGDYIVGLLPPGVYTLTFQLSGFERQQKTVVLAPTQTLPLDVTMGLARLAENVVVVGNSADVLTQTPQVATNFKQDMIAMLPTNRDITVPLLMAPGVHPTGPAGNYSFMGAMSFESRYMVNGVTVNENLRGQPNNLYIEDAIQETTVATDGISAEYGRFSGGVVNVITKSGGNLFSGSFRDTLNNDNWRTYVTGNDAHPFTSDCDTCGAGGAPSKVDMVVPQYQYVLGGPIMKDRLWFFTAGRFQNQSFSRSTIAPLNIPYVAENKRAALRSQADRVDQLESSIRGRLHQGGADAGQRRAKHRHGSGESLSRARPRRTWSRSVTTATCRRRSSSKAASRCGGSRSSAAARRSPIASTAR